MKDGPYKYRAMPNRWEAGIANGHCFLGKASGYRAARQRGLYCLVRSCFLTRCLSALAQLPQIVNMSEKTILLVDDDSEDQLLMQEAFSDNGMGDSLRFADNGESAIELLGQLPPDKLPGLIVMDLNMPRMNGRETLTYLKQHPLYHEIPVIIYSTSINDIERDRCKEIGAAAYITKPASFKECQQIAWWFHKVGNEASGK